MIKGGDGNGYTTVIYRGQSMSLAEFLMHAVTSTKAAECPSCGEVFGAHHRSPHVPEVCPYCSRKMILYGFDDKDKDDGECAQ